MKVIGLTGNIGCGKSTVAGWLREMGVAVIDAGRRRAPDPQQRRGGATPRSSGASARSRRGKLAPIVFSDPAALRDLEAILHPLVRDEIRARLAELEAAGAEAACIEAIKLLESPLNDALRQHLGGALRRGGCPGPRWRRRAA